MYSKRLLTVAFLVTATLTVAVVAQSFTEFKYNSSEECRAEDSRRIHPICTFQANLFSTSCYSDGEMLLGLTGVFFREFQANMTVYCSAKYPIEIVIKSHERSILDVSLDFPEFERTVEDITKPETYVYHIRIPYGFITRSDSDVKSFTIRSVNSTSIATTFIKDHNNNDFIRRKEIERSRTLRSVIPVTQELINLPCPIYGWGYYPNGVHRIQSKSNGVSIKRNLLDIIVEGPKDPSSGWELSEITDLRVAFGQSNIPVDNKRLLWDQINGFRFNISNFVSKEYLGSYFCTTGRDHDITIAKNFTLIDLKGSFGKPDYDKLFTTTIGKTVDVSFECVSTKNITFENTFDRVSINTFVITRVKSPEFYLVYYLNIRILRTDAGIVRCIEIGSQKPVRTWHLRVRDMTNQEFYQPSVWPYLYRKTFPFRLKQDTSSAGCMNSETAGSRSVKYLTCRNVMECEMVKFCLHDDASCPNIVTIKNCEESYDCFSFKPPDNGILNCRLYTDGVLRDMTVTYFKGFDGKIYADWVDAPIPALIQLEKDILGKATLYSKDWLRISCKGHRMLTGGLIQWILQFKNNSWIHIQGLERSNSHVIVKAEKLLDGIESTLHIYLTDTDIVAVTCMVPVWNSDQWMNVSQDLNIVEPSKPKIKTDGSNKSFKIGSKDQSISCEVLSDPESELTWTKLGSNTTHNLTTLRLVNFASLQFPEFSSNDVGDYMCEASNIGGIDSKIFHVSIDKGSSSVWLYSALGVVLILLFISVSLALWIRRKLQIAKRVDAETQIKEAIDKFLNGYEDEDSNADKYPYNNEYEIPMEDLTIDRIQVLGSGAFGVVYRGRMEDRSGTVAVKTLQQMPRYNVEHFQALMSELKLLIFIGKHPNIVELVGAVTVKIHSGEFYIVSEECVLGCLQNFLRSKRHNMGQTGETSVDYVDLTNDDWRVKEEQELLDCLMKWSYQIADAMEFLSAKNVIHADLATRNILLTAEQDAKLTDFGLSRKLYNYVQYVKKKKEPLPWAWMSIEALRDLTFSTKSDVWSYGVVLWEMYSFAAVPYGGMNWHPGFVQDLIDGLRLSKPELANDAIYDTMQSCWNNEPGNRPDFTRVKSCLGNIQQGHNSSMSVATTSHSDNDGQHINV